VIKYLKQQHVKDYLCGGDEQNEHTLEHMKIANNFWRIRGEEQS